MIINCNQNSSDQNYFTLIQTVVPRPIAWVLSDNGNNSYNLAPFSFFNVVASNPAMIMLSVGWKDEQTRKDTWINIDQRNHFVVHIPSVKHISDVAKSAATLAHGVSEIDQLNIQLDKIEGQALPKIKDCNVAFFCEKYRIEEIGNDQQGLILGKINHIWINDAIVSYHEGRLIIDPVKLDPLARLGGSYYSGLGEILTMKRPD